MTLPETLPPPETPPSGAKGFWPRLKQHIIHPELSPEQVALSFALGFSIAWNPLLGLHTALILGLCLVFKRLHRPLMIAAAFVNNPWTLMPIATASTVLGNLLLGRGWMLDFTSIHWETIGWKSFVTVEGFTVMRVMLKPVLVPYLLGGTVLSLVALPVGYYVMLSTARRLQATAAQWRKTHSPHSLH